MGIKQQDQAISLDKIRVEGRVIRGNGERLASSIALNGLRHPVLLAPDDTLLSGYRRIDAARRLRWKIIGYRYVEYLEDAVDAMAAEREDPEAAPPTPYDAWVIGNRLERLARHPRGRGMEVRELIGRALGIGGSTYSRIRGMYSGAVRGEPDACEAVRRIENGASVGNTYAWWRQRADAPRYSADEVPDGTPLAELGEPPEPSAKSPTAAALRRAFVREMARTGHTADQIGARLRMTAAGARRIARKAGIEIKADAITARARKNPVDSNAVIVRAVEDLDAIKWSLSQVDVTALDDEQADGWAKELSSFAHQTMRLVKAIRSRKE